MTIIVSSRSVATKLARASRTSVEPTLKFVSRCSTANSGLENSIQMQADVDLCNTLGGRTLVMPRGTFDFSATFANPFEAGGGDGRKLSVRWRSKVFLEGQGEDTIIRWEDDALTAGTRRDMFVFGLASNCGIKGVKFVGNTAGNLYLPAETNPPMSQLKSCFLGTVILRNDAGKAISWNPGTAGAFIVCGSATNQGYDGACSNVFFEDIITTDHYWYGLSLTRATGVKLKRLKTVDAGCMLEAIYCTEGEARSIEHKNSNPSLFASDDPVEIASSTKFIVDGFDVEANELGGTLDIAGQDIIVTNGVCRAAPLTGLGSGPVVQCEGANRNLPNSNKVLLSNIKSYGFYASGADGFQVLVGNTGDCEVTLDNCQAFDCFKSLDILGQGGLPGTGTVTIRNFTSTGHIGYGLLTGAVNKLVVRNSDFSKGDDGNSFGILIYTGFDTADGQTRVEIDTTTARGNARFGAAVEEGHPFMPSGFLRVDATGNRADNTYYPIDARECQIYNPYPANALLELTNTAQQRIHTRELDSIAISGDKTIYWGYAVLKSLNNMGYNQITRIIFQQQTRVVDVAQGLGGNISMASGQQEWFRDDDWIEFRWDGSLARELGRSQSVFVPFTPDQLTAFQQWHKRDFGMFTDAAKTLPVTLGSADRVRAWAPFRSGGTPFDITAATDAKRPLTHVDGGIIGNSLDNYMTTDIVDLSPPFTILLVCNAAAVETRNWAGVDGDYGAGGFHQWSFRSGNASTAEFYENADVSPVAMGASLGQILFGISVAVGGATTLWRQDGTNANGNGSSGGTAATANSRLSLLCGYGDTGPIPATPGNPEPDTPASATMRITDVIISRAVATANEIAYMRGYFA